MTIDNDAMRAWLTYPTTQAVFKELKAEREALTEAILDGTILDLESVGKTGTKLTYLLGRIKGLNSILNMTIVDEPNEQ